MRDQGSEAWKIAYITLERYVRVHQDDPKLDDGLLGMHPKKVEVRTFGGIRFVWIPRGWFVAGTRIESNLVLHGYYPDSFRTELERVHLDGFWISETELTVAQAGKHGIPDGALAVPTRELLDNPDLAERLPAVLGLARGTEQVNTALKALLERFTAKVQKEGHNFAADLPTERQWEKAARGDDGRLYPWGNSLARGKRDIPELVRTGLLAVRPVGTTAVDTSPYGVKDMVGNVGEPVIRSGPATYYEWQLAGRPVVVRGCGVHADGFAEPLVSYRSKNGPLGIRLVLNPADKKQQ